MASLVIVESPTKARTIRDFLPRAIMSPPPWGTSAIWPDKAADIPAKLKEKSGLGWGSTSTMISSRSTSSPPTRRKWSRSSRTCSRTPMSSSCHRRRPRRRKTSWHLTQVLMPKVKVRRMVFHEITREAIREALDTTRDVDDKLVRARKPAGSSTGCTDTRSRRCSGKRSPTACCRQGAQLAVRLLVLRERERRAFRRAVYWDLKARLAHQRQEFDAELVSVKGVRVASGKDFDEKTGKLAADKKVVLLDEPAAAKLRDRLQKSPGGSPPTKRSPASAGPPRRSRHPRCSRKPTASSGCRPGTSCGSPRVCTKTDSSPTCAPIRCICPGRP